MIREDTRFKILKIQEHKATRDTDYYFNILKQLKGV